MNSARARLATLAATLLLVSACGSTSHGTTTDDNAGQKTHTMSDGSTMTDAQMKDMEHSHAQGDSSRDEQASAPGNVSHRTHGPSQPAGMICSLEIAQAVKRTFALPSVPQARDSWAGHAYTCDYRVGSSTLRLSVQDLDHDPAGRAYFDALTSRLTSARPIRGLQNLGFPALSTPGSVGAVAFLKDHKTLLVDAGKVARSDLPPGFTRTGAAYGVAAAVIACWTE